MSKDINKKIAVALCDDQLEKVSAGGLFRPDTIEDYHPEECYCPHCKKCVSYLDPREADYCFGCGAWVESCTWLDENGNLIPTGKSLGDLDSYKIL